MNQKISLKIPSNTIGRDFVIGDLHGCFEQLKNRLAEVNFDPSTDRVFSVGDLIDRGPQSLECLRLLNEPWFFAVKGNHESMLLNYLGVERAYLSNRNSFIDNGGGWVQQLTSSERVELQDLAEKHVKDLPYQIEVAHSQLPFFVTHSGHGVFGQPLDSPSQMDTLSNAELEQILWERDYFRGCLSGLNTLSVKTRMAAYGMGFNRAALDHDPVRINATKSIDYLVYAGHNALRIPILANNHFFIDTGCGKTGTLTMIEHQKLLNKVSDTL